MSATGCWHAWASWCARDWCRAHWPRDCRVTGSPSISVGIAAVTGEIGDFAPALAQAETACKAAKDRGRNRVELYQSSDVSIVRRYADVNIAPSLRAANTENQSF